MDGSPMEWEPTLSSRPRPITSFYNNQQSYQRVSLPRPNKISTSTHLTRTSSIPARSSDRINRVGTGFNDRLTRFPTGRIERNSKFSTRLNERNVQQSPSLDNRNAISSRRSITQNSPLPTQSVLRPGLPVRPIDRINHCDRLANAPSQHVEVGKPHPVLKRSFEEYLNGQQDDIHQPIEQQAERRTEQPLRGFAKTILGQITGFVRHATRLVAMIRPWCFANDVKHESQTSQLAIVREGNKRRAYEMPGTYPASPSRPNTRPASPPRRRTSPSRARPSHIILRNSQQDATTPAPLPPTTPPLVSSNPIQQSPSAERSLRSSAPSPQSSPLARSQPSPITPPKLLPSILPPSAQPVASQPEADSSKLPLLGSPPLSPPSFSSELSPRPQPRSIVRSTHHSIAASLAKAGATGRIIPIPTFLAKPRFRAPFDDTIVRKAIPLSKPTSAGDRSGPSSAVSDIIPPTSTILEHNPLESSVSFVQNRPSYGQRESAHDRGLSATHTVRNTVNQDLSFLPDASPGRARRNVHFGEDRQFGTWSKPIPTKIKYYDPAKKVGETPSPYNRRFFKVMRETEPKSSPAQSDGPSPDRPVNLPPFLESPALSRRVRHSSPTTKDNVDPFGDLDIEGLVEDVLLFGLSHESKQVLKQKRERERKEVEAAAERERKRLEEEKKKIEEERLREAREKRKRLTIVVKLSPEWEAKVDETMAIRTPTHEITNALTRKDFGTLLPQGRAEGIGWLNDEIVNSFLSSLVEKGLQKTGYSKRANEVPKYHAFSTHLYTNFTTKGFKSVERWLSRAKIGGKRLLETEKVFIPINDHSHWTLISVSGMKRTIEYYDSMSGNPSRYTKFALAFVKGALDKDFKPDEWKIIDVSSAQQANALDCGVFVCMNALALMQGREPEAAFGARDMPSARRMVAGTLLNGGFSGDFDIDIE